MNKLNLFVYLGMSRSAEWTPIRLSIALSMLMIAKASSPGEVNSRMPCDQANLKCAYRTGCGSALQSYLVQCASIHQGDSTECPESCQHALIALTSTDEGKDLMTVRKWDVRSCPALTFFITASIDYSCDVFYFAFIYPLTVFSGRSLCCSVIAHLTTRCAMSPDKESRFVDHLWC